MRVYEVGERLARGDDLGEMRVGVSKVNAAYVGQAGSNVPDDGSPVSQKHAVGVACVEVIKDEQSRESEKKENGDGKSAAYEMVPFNGHKPVPYATEDPPDLAEYATRG